MMTCNFRIIVNAEAIELTSPMDYFQCESVILGCMKIKNVAPVLDEAEGNRLCNEAMRRAKAERRRKAGK